MKREFYCQDDKSNKFWTIDLVGQTVVTTNGRIGAKPREARNELPTKEAARSEIEKLIASKLRKGYVEGKIEKAPKYEPPDWASMKMSDEVFWRIIGLFNWKKLGDDDAVIGPAVKALAQMSNEDILRFEDILSEKLYALDTEALAKEIGEEAFQPGKYFSVDWFLYSRCVVVANGREVFESVIADPKQMPKDGEFEALLSVAREAYERKTGNEFDHTSPICYETYSNRNGWKDAVIVESGDESSD
ncbi:MAG: DUF4240 domain-containing protein [Planctomycetaceae bacterium]